MMRFVVAGALVSLTLVGCGGGDDPAVAASAAAEASASAAASAAVKARDDARIKANAEAEASRNAAEAKAEAEAEALASAQAAVPPKAEDFTLTIKVLEKQCFGSAGCNVTFRIDPKYNGTADSSNTEVTYEVLGAEDEIINTFTIDSAGTASFDSNEFASTSSSSKTLTAKVTDVQRTS